ncbi:N-acetylmuramoyl-L-alanine amidase [Herbaspirillum sp.]|uniref:N-acetylmuramoyl-L-alanine amidase n=1 Tax=Herbaspirillum sp. TaxID=1890675 RepID=UPI00258BD977|nr:N-acetylmuramoyl-L-alanine amidase [Herbaspirillum sp.]MCP3948522.1 N-acetylmuramoyl-L-alanine amidase [Herbaspirillum sp.]
MKNLIVLHTTEGHSIESAIHTMNRNRSQCHEVVDPSRPVTEMLTPWTQPARSLTHPPSTPETNNRGFTATTRHLGKVYQIEVVGFAREVAGYSAKWYQRLARYLAIRCTLLDVPRRFPYQFQGEDAYGVNGVARIGWDEWATVAGIVGHQIVPGNRHWDPGPLNRIIPLVIREKPMDGKETPVAAMQRRLVARGHDLGTSGPNGDGVDGDFGELSLRAGIQESIKAERFDVAIDGLTAIANGLQDAEPD